MEFISFAFTMKHTSNLTEKCADVQPSIRELLLQFKCLLKYHLHIIKKMNMHLKASIIVYKEVSDNTASLNRDSVHFTVFYVPLHLIST